VYYSSEPGRWQEGQEKKGALEGALSAGSLHLLSKKGANPC
jgi:hypothetical protein